MKDCNIDSIFFVGTVLLLFIMNHSAFAQGNAYGDRTILKLDVPALALNSYQVQSEYLVHQKFSLALSVR